MLLKSLFTISTLFVPGVPVGFDWDASEQRTACIESELGQAPILGCAGTNITCLCFNVAFLGAIGECSNLNCTAPETNATLAFVIELCEAAFNEFVPTPLAATATGVATVPGVNGFLDSPITQTGHSVNPTLASVIAPFISTSTAQASSSLTQISATDPPTNLPPKPGPTKASNAANSMQAVVRSSIFIKLTIGLGVGIGVLLLLLILFVIFQRRSYKKKELQRQQEQETAAWNAQFHPGGPTTRNPPLRPPRTPSANGFDDKNGSGIQELEGEAQWITQLPATPLLRGYETRISSA
ncbi:hypothetical protein MMC06_000578 [Schaereria dolodes]|nr:hypothetical protein [Schaereria dolodes]